VGDFTIDLIAGHKCTLTFLQAGKSFGCHPDISHIVDRLAHNTVVGGLLITE
jgi:hypothetical protein